VLEIAEKVKKIVGNGVEIVSLPVVDNRSYRVSGEKIRHQLDFFPMKNIEDAIREIVEQFSLGTYKDPGAAKYFNLKRMQELLSTKELDIQ
jgi:nucleoside-diphosphate-sugar epimerase